MLRPEFVVEILFREVFGFGLSDKVMVIGKRILISWPSLIVPIDEQAQGSL